MKASPERKNKSCLKQAKRNNKSPNRYPDARASSLLAQEILYLCAKVFSVVQKLKNKLARLMVNPIAVLFNSKKISLRV